MNRAITGATEKYKNENVQLAKDLNTVRSTIIEQSNKIKNLESELNQIKESTNDITMNHTLSKPDSLIQKALKNSQNSSDKTLQELTEDQIKVMSAFFENDTTMFTNSIKDFVFKKYDLSKVLIDSRIKELANLGYISRLQHAMQSTYQLSDQGQHVIEELFT